VELEHADSKTNFHLPSGKATRKIAGKAGKAATKGASKMASAFKKGLRRAQAMGETNATGSAPMGAGEHAEDAAGLMDAEDAAEGDLQEGGAAEDGALYDAPASGAPRPAQQAAREPERPGRARAAEAPQPRAAQEPACRALQLGSIWEIPTSRFPEPLAEPSVEAGDLEARVIGAQRSPLPPVAVSLKKGKKAAAKRGPRRKPCLSRRAKLALGLLLALSVVAAAVAASL